MEPSKRVEEATLSYKNTDESAPDNAQKIDELTAKVQEQGERILQLEAALKDRDQAMQAQINAAFEERMKFLMMQIESYCQDTLARTGQVVSDLNLRINGIAENIRRVDARLNFGLLTHEAPRAPAEILQRRNIGSEACIHVSRSQNTEDHAEEHKCSPLELSPILGRSNASSVGDSTLSGFDPELYVYEEREDEPT